MLRPGTVRVRLPPHRPDRHLPARGPWTTGEEPRWINRSFLTANRRLPGTIPERATLPALPSRHAGPSCWLPRLQVPVSERHPRASPGMTSRNAPYWCFTPAVRDFQRNMPFFFGCNCWFERADQATRRSLPLASVPQFSQPAPARRQRELSGRCRRWVARSATQEEQASTRAPQA